jgi:hypothetical protein
MRTSIQPASHTGTDKSTATTSPRVAGCPLSGVSPVAVHMSDALAALLAVYATCFLPFSRLGITEQ